MAGKSLNRATLIGHVGKDAEVRYTGTGKAVASFSVATNVTWTDKTSGQPVEKTDWHNIVAWNRLAEICGQYVKKGKRIFIEGPIQTRSYDKDGVKHYMTEIVADDIMFLDGGGGGNDGGQGRQYEGGGQSRGQSDGGSYRPAAPASGGYQAPQPDYEPQSAPVDDLPF